MQNEHFSWKMFLVRNSVEFRSYCEKLTNSVKILFAKDALHFGPRDSVHSDLDKRIQKHQTYMHELIKFETDVFFKSEFWCVSFLYQLVTYGLRFEQSSPNSTRERAEETKARHKDNLLGVGGSFTMNVNRKLISKIKRSVHNVRFGPD